MAATTKEWGGRGGAARSWTITTSGDQADTFGYDLTALITVASGDTVTLEGSVDGTRWVTIKAYTENTVESLPNVPILKATFGGASTADIYGTQNR